MPNFALCGKRKQATTKFYLSSWTWIWNSTPGQFAYIWQSRWVGIVAIKTERAKVRFKLLKAGFLLSSPRWILNFLIYHTRSWKTKKWNTPFILSEIDVQEKLCEVPRELSFKDGRLGTYDEGTTLHLTRRQNCVGSASVSYFLNSRDFSLQQVAKLILKQGWDFGSSFLKGMKKKATLPALACFWRTRR